MQSFRARSDSTIQRASARRRPRALPRYVAALIGVVVFALGFSSVAAAVTVPTTPAEHHRLGADWIAAQLDNEIPLTTWSPDWGITIEAAIALHSAGVHGDQVNAAWDAIKANLADVIDPFGSPSPGRYARVILLADALGEDPTNIAGVDLVAGLLAEYDSTTGLFGSGPATWDGIARQSLSILALIEAGETVPEPAIDWLINQQCDDLAQTDFYGSWMMEAPVAGCEIDTVNFVGPDTNATAMAIATLDALINGPGFGDPADALDAVDRIQLGVAWLANEQNADGGWGLNVGYDSDPNSTGVVLQGLHHLGLTNDALFDKAGATPWTYLASLQLICVPEVEDRGAFEFPLMGPGPDMMASVQAVGGMSGGYVPSIPSGSLPTFVLDCTIPTTTTTSTTTTTVLPTTTTVMPADPTTDTTVPPVATPAATNTPGPSAENAAANRNVTGHDTLARTGGEPHTLTVTALLFMAVGGGLMIASADPVKILRSRRNTQAE